ncbi:ketoacyl-synt-domain-containing protein [Aspergillus costaricaensis CBS 115574]|uniref:Ketoacyl-synt-domain-containing protein n=1 Tax=Aspergillus costaricaensis CBS 115574 TaxID=1448317 RepID=A0ACD1IGG9_9EURO|nr:ketoacyl-synt-domain-containing protein [Aspergillus costaricaensis CBS 115574]RAK89718.1 ketoacyl-synt-domain-containing protein [Aspergillus costaricaensis CBS 115574]
MLRTGKISGQKLVYGVSTRKLSNANHTRGPTITPRLCPHILHEKGTVIGSSCRFPGGINSPSALWNLLKSPKDLLKPIPRERFDTRGFYHPDSLHHGTTNVKDCYLLEQDPGVFDAEFFGISPAEATSMDPQQRIMLEVVYEAIESAGYSIDDIRGTDTGVFVACMWSDYADIQQADMDTIPQHSATGTARSILSNRISHFFDLKGPSMTIDTACSSSLVAIHQAMQSLRNGESRMAIVAGANLILRQEAFISESNMNMLSPHGRSKMWAADADGYGRGEGFSAVLLKLDRNATADGDHVECVVRETGVNHDGHTRGITVPSSKSQESLIKSTYVKAGLDLSRESDQCQYFEAHGTGTPAGDPIEAEAIFNSLIRGRPRENPLRVGSIKTIIGHLEGCAGLAGLLKASLSLQNAAIPPNLHLTTLNPRVAPFYKLLKVPTQLESWPNHQHLSIRRASVNSFGFGGTNAHVILESASDRSASRVYSAPAGPLVVSAASPSSLRANVQSLHGYIQSMDEINLNDLTYTLQRRTTLPFLTSFPGGSRTELIKQMASWTTTEAAGDKGGVSSSQAIKTSIWGIFTGQGAHWVGMARILVHNCMVFRETIDALDEVLRALRDPPKWTLIDELIGAKDRNSVGLKSAAILQPLCTAIQLGLLALLRHAGIEFDTIIGHSSGEIAAAYAAGCISRDDAIRISFYRGLHGTSTEKDGAMAAIKLSPAAVFEIIEGLSLSSHVCIAAYNSQESVTVSGDTMAIDLLISVATAANIAAKKLTVDIAYHSSHMENGVQPYLDSLHDSNLAYSPCRPRCLWVSTVTGKPMGSDIDSLHSTYWAENLVKPVQFKQAIESALIERGRPGIVLEVGPHHTLKGPVLETIDKLHRRSVPYTSLLKRDTDDIQCFSGALGCVWEHCGSSAVDFVGYLEAFSDKPQTKVLKALPPYSWDHEKIYWHESRLSEQHRTRSNPPHDLLGVIVPTMFDDGKVFRNIIHLSEMPWLKGHRFQGEVVLPAAAYVSAALEAVTVEFKNREVGSVEIRNAIIHHAVRLEEDSAGVELVSAFDVVHDEDDSPRGTIFVISFSCHTAAIRTGFPAKKVFSCELSVIIGHSWLDQSDEPGAMITPSSMADVGIESVYSNLRLVGLEYADLFRCLASASRDMPYASASIIAPTSSSLLHTTILDACFQTTISAYSPSALSAFWSPFLPRSIGRIHANFQFLKQHACSGESLRINANITDSSSASIHADVGLYHESTGRVLLHMEDVTLAPLSHRSADQDKIMFWQETWREDTMSGSLIQPFPREGRREQERLELMDVMERLAYWFLRSLRNNISPDQVDTMPWHKKLLFEFAGRVVETGLSADTPSYRPEWKHDSFEQIEPLLQGFVHTVDLQILLAAGQSLVPIMRGEVDALSVVMKNDLLSRFYRDAVTLEGLNSAFSKLVKPICHKFPQSRILEIGAGTGGTTGPVLDTVYNACVSYTYTDISSAFFESAQSAFAQYGDKMEFKVLDIEKDVEMQNYEEESFHLIIAANVFHATKSLSNTIRNVRRLLAPGGYLVFGEVTTKRLHHFTTFGTLPGWWLGFDEGRQDGPTIGPAEWDRLLQENGFSGIDRIMFDTQDIRSHTHSVIVTQATSIEIDILRQPLKFQLDVCRTLQGILIVGGRTLRTKRLLDHIIGSLAPSLVKVTVVGSLELLYAGEQKGGSKTETMVLYMGDLDGPLLENFTAPKLLLLQRFLNEYSDILYITDGSSPFSKMMTGIARSVDMELSKRRLHMVTLDCPTGSNQESQNVLVLFLQFIFTKHLLNRATNLILSDESELVLHNDSVMIPRLVPDQCANNRFNSANREIIIERHYPDIHGRRLQLDSKRRLKEKDIKTVDPVSGNVRIRVLRSMHPAVKVYASYLYLCVGIRLVDNKACIAFVDQAATIVDVPEELLFACEYPASEWNDLLSMLLVRLISRQGMEMLCPGGCICFHDPDLQAISIIRKRAEENGLQVLFTTTRSGGEQASDTIVITPLTTCRKLTSRLPRNLDLFLDLSEKGSNSVLTTRLRSCLPTNTRQVDFSWFFQVESTCNENDSSALGAFKIDAVPLSHLEKSSFKKQIVDWTLHCSVSVLVQPIQCTVSLYDPRKTYVFVGLSGDLGHLLCRRMAEDGARYFVLCSRQPTVTPELTNDLERLQCTIKTYSLDVTDLQAVRCMHTELSKSMPAIGGVLHGAMVMSDSLWSNMTFDEYQKVFAPKAQGAIYLDRIFQEDTIDFFVLVSSAIGIIGNPGQANYAAANVFLHALANERRKRGLVASVVALSAVGGIGYFARSGRQVQSQIERLNIEVIPESEIYPIFAESIGRSKHSESRHSCEVITGLRRIEDSAPEHTRPEWYSKPRFSHLIVPGKGSHQNTGQVGRDTSVRAQLSRSERKKDAEEITLEGLQLRLAHMLQRPVTTIDPLASPVSLGIDSLMAVHIRTWFLQELESDIPVLRILGDVSIAEICNQALAISPVIGE